MLREVSFNWPPRGPMPSATMGGSLLTTLKNENGAALRAPCGDWLTTQAMGRGTTTLESSLKASAEASLLKSKFMAREGSSSFGQQPQRAEQPLHVCAVLADISAGVLGRQRHQRYRLILH